MNVSPPVKLARMVVIGAAAGSTAFEFFVVHYGRILFR
jgi:hypothetical protein